MYKKWTVQDIAVVIEKLNKQLNYNCDIKIEISKRAKKRMGAFFYKKGKDKIEPIKFVFAEKLINGSYEEKIVYEVIVHEYLHYYCDTKTNISNGHNKYFKTMCKMMNISDEATFKYNNENNIISDYKYKIYCGKCNKLVCVHKRKDFAYKKINNYISSCCKAKLFMK